MHVNVSDYVRDAAARWGQDVALVQAGRPDRTVTWSALDAEVDALARALSGRGLVAGQRVALVMANRVDLAVAYFAVLRGGMVAVPLNPRSAVPEVARALADSGAQLVLCDDVGVATVRAALQSGDGPAPGCAVVVTGARAKRGETSWQQLLESAGSSVPTAPRDPEALAVLLYTSGVSGRPRAAMLPHRALVANIEQVAAVEPSPLTHDETCLVLLPLFHVYGLNAVLGQAVRQGARAVLVDRYDPAALLELVRDEGVTNLALAPPVFADWTGRPGLREALSGVRRVLCGAAALDPDLAAEFTAASGHGVEQGYGLTETAPVLTTTLGVHRPDGAPPKPASVGVPLPGVELRVVDASGADAQPDDPGEVWVRGDNVFVGYWPDAGGGPDADGWFRTGDVGLLDRDGELTLVDRLRELVIVSGFNVYPVEVEVVVAEVEGVAQAAVVGVPDAQTGEAVLAFVVPEEGQDAAELERRVHERCEHALARFKRPSRVVLVEGLPYSPTGKVVKGRLRSLARREVLGMDPS